MAQDVAELRAIRAEMDAEELERVAHAEAIAERQRGTLRWRRYDAGLSQRELAQRAGVTRLTITHAEAGRCSLKPETKARLAAVLGVTPEEVREWRTT